MVSVSNLIAVKIDTLGIVPNRRNSLALLGVNKMIADETCFLLHEPTYTATITKLMLFERLHNFHIDFSQVLDLGERSTLRIELLSTSSVDFSDDKAKGKELVDGPMMQDALGSIIDCLRDAYSISQKFRGLTRIEIVVQGPLSDRLTKKTEIELEDQFFDCVLIVLEKMEDRLHEF